MAVTAASVARGRVAVAQDQRARGLGGGGLAQQEQHLDRLARGQRQPALQGRAGVERRAGASRKRRADTGGAAMLPPRPRTSVRSALWLVVGPEIGKGDAAGKAVA
jgi:hypothetical protein